MFGRKKLQRELQEVIELLDYAFDYIEELEFELECVKADRKAAITEIFQGKDKND